MQNRIDVAFQLFVSCSAEIHSSLNVNSNSLQSSSLASRLDYLLLEVDLRTWVARIWQLGYSFVLGLLRGKESELLLRSLLGRSLNDP